jgi:hypothetical protein
LQWSKKKKLHADTFWIILLRGIQDECIDLLNLMGRGDISHISYEDICELCKHYSQGNAKHVNVLDMLLLESPNQLGEELPKMKLEIY